MVALSVYQEKLNVDETDALRYKLLAEFPYFCEYFFYAVFGNKFKKPKRNKKTNHVDVILNALINVHEGKTQYLNINVPPGHGKTTLLILFVAWSLAVDPECNFIYTSYSATLAEDQTQKIRDVITSEAYQALFPTRIMADTKAKGKFRTTAFGTVVAAGVGGSITGFDAGKAYSGGKFKGCVLIDDSLKIEDSYSTTLRERVNNWYYSTLVMRKRSKNTPIIHIGQRTHVEDLSSIFVDRKDGHHWDNIVLPVIAEDGKVLDPDKHTLEELEAAKKNDPYTFYAQLMNNPSPMGETLFIREDFKIIETLPDITNIFITGDVAETNNKQNDASAFTAWGVFNPIVNNKKSNYQAIVMLGCIEIWVKPDELEKEFLTFYGRIENIYGKVERISIENKSMGVALNAFLMNRPGINVVPVTRISKFSKLDRINQAQPYSKQGLVCLLKENRLENELFITHMEKIMPNHPAARDDIADTFADAINIALIKKLFNNCKSESNRKVNDAFDTYRNSMGAMNFGQARY